MICEPKDRYTAEQVLNHTWVHNLAPNSEEILLHLNMEHLKSYRKFNQLKKAALTFIASRLKDDEIKELKEIFNTLDTNQDGTLTIEEVKTGISKLKDGKDINLEELFYSIDTDGSGVINYTEFLAATIDQNVYLKEERLYEAFKALDKDNSGKISSEEVRSIMQGDIDDQKLKELIKIYDTNNDGEIDYNEFIMMMSKTEI